MWKNRIINTWNLFFISSICNVHLRSIFRVRLLKKAISTWVSKMRHIFLTLPWKNLIHGGIVCWYLTCIHAGKSRFLPNVRLHQVAHTRYARRLELKNFYRLTRSISCDFNARQSYDRKWFWLLPTWVLILWTPNPISSNFDSHLNSFVRE